MNIPTAFNDGYKNSSLWQLLLLFLLLYVQLKNVCGALKFSPLTYTTQFKTDIVRTRAYICILIIDILFVGFFFHFLRVSALAEQPYSVCVYMHLYAEVYEKWTK